MTRATERKPAYLEPYLQAARTHGAGFGTLLWASPQTQSARFEALRRIADLHGKSVLDAGCGRADLLEDLLDHGIKPADYIGIEAVDALAGVAEAKRLPRATIVRADFVAEPARLFVGAQVIIFCGSLNTANDLVFYSTLARAFEAASETLVFNFLCSARLAGKPYLHWRRPEHVIGFARSLSRNITTLGDYLDGDMAVRIERKTG